MLCKQTKWRSIIYPRTQCTGYNIVDNRQITIVEGDLNICWQYNVQQPLTHFNNPILNSNKQICGEGENSSEALPG